MPTALVVCVCAVVRGLRISVMPRSAIIDPVTFTANRAGSPRPGHVYGRTVTVLYQYGHVGGLTVGCLGSTPSRSISGPN